MTRSFGLTFATLIILSSCIAAAQDGTRSVSSGTSGRFQLVGVGSDWVFMVDTTSGQTWKRTIHGEWQTAGNPVIELPNEGVAPRAQTPRLNLPAEGVDLSVGQRQQAEIPGSAGSLHVKVGDITAEQAIVQIVAANGEILLSPRSMRAGERTRFQVRNRDYELIVDELRNFLIGDDVAIFSVQQMDDADDRSAPRASRRRIDREPVRSLRRQPQSSELREATKEDETDRPEPAEE